MFIKTTYVVAVHISLLHVLTKENSDSFPWQFLSVRRQMPDVLEYNKLYSNVQLLFIWYKTLVITLFKERADWICMIQLMVIKVA
jgi:hypothetical protein